MKKILYSIAIILLTIQWGCSKKPAQTQTKTPFVKMAYALSKDVPNYIATVGHMEAYKTVNIMAQVDGKLMKTYFADGADLKQGDLLYLIDQRPYLADVEKAEGQLAENIASLGFAERSAERNSKLVKDDYISHNDFDNLITTVLVDDALVKQARASLENAKINLSYTTIYAPLDARAGESQIRDGNLILESAETTLVTLNQITPIYATFYINEKDLPRVQRYKAKYNNLKTMITVDDQSSLSCEGILTFIDNKIDLATGMIKLKATLPNEDKVLWPNQYVKVQLILETLENAVLVPIEAIQNSSNGKYVYVIKGNQTVDCRSVTVGQMQDDNTIVITKGLKAREKVVTEGQINLYPGAKVSIASNEDEE